MAIDEIYGVIDKAAGVFTSGSSANADATAFMSNLHSWIQTTDNIAMHSLLPLAMTGLIFHELWTATQENRAFRVGWVFFRVVGCVALLLSYGHVVGALTGVLGGPGAWSYNDRLLDGLSTVPAYRLALFANDPLNGAGSFLFWMLLFFLDLLTAFFAWAVVALLAKFQAVMIIIFISAGKSCIVLSLIPGVGIAKSWAKALATVAAWSWMGGLVYAAIGQAFGLGDAIVASNSTSIAQHAQLWLYFAMLGLFSMSIPRFVSAITSGAVSGAPSIMPLVGGLYLAKAGLTKAVKGGASAVGKAVSASEPGGGGGRAGRAGGKVSRGGSDARLHPIKKSREALTPKPPPSPEGNSSQLETKGVGAKGHRGHYRRKQVENPPGDEGAPLPAAGPSPALGADKKPGGSPANEAKRPAGKQGGSSTGGTPGAPVLPEAGGHSVQGPSSAPAASGKQRHAQPVEASSPGAAPSSPSRQKHAAGAASPAPQAAESRSSSSPTSSSVDAEFAKPSPASVGQPAVARGDGAPATARPQATERPQGEPGGHGASPSDVEGHPAPTRGRPSRKQDR